jgi:hypothetical protein
MSSGTERLRNIATQARDHSDRRLAARYELDIGLVARLKNDARGFLLRQQRWPHQFP